MADDGSVYTETSTRSPPIITKTGGIVAETQSFWPMPTGPLVMRSVGMPSDGIPVTWRPPLHCGSSGTIPGSEPTSCSSFWSSVIAPTSSAARASGVSAVFIHGNDCASVAGACSMSPAASTANPKAMDLTNRLPPALSAALAFRNARSANECRSPWDGCFIDVSSNNVMLRNLTSGIGALRAGATNEPNTCAFATRRAIGSSSLEKSDAHTASCRRPNCGHCRRAAAGRHLSKVMLRRGALVAASAS